MNDVLNLPGLAEGDVLAVDGPDDVVEGCLGGDTQRFSDYAWVESLSEP